MYLLTVVSAQQSRRLIKLNSTYNKLQLLVLQIANNIIRQIKCSSISITLRQIHNVFYLLQIFVLMFSITVKNLTNSNRNFSAWKLISASPGLNPQALRVGARVFTEPSRLTSTRFYCISSVHKIVYRNRKWSINQALG